MCEKQYNVEEKQVENLLGPWLRAPNRNVKSSIGERWLRQPMVANRIGEPMTARMEVIGETRKESGSVNAESQVGRKKERNLGDIGENMEKILTDGGEDSVSKESKSLMSHPSMMANRTGELMIPRVENDGDTGKESGLVNGEDHAERNRNEIWGMEGRI